jgi:hypothetical protein
MPTRADHVQRSGILPKQLPSATTQERNQPIADEEAEVADSSTTQAEHVWFLTRNTYAASDHPELGILYHKYWSKYHGYSRDDAKAKTLSDGHDPKCELPTPPYLRYLDPLSQARIFLADGLIQELWVRTAIDLLKFYEAEETVCESFESVKNHQSRLVNKIQPHP